MRKKRRNIKPWCEQRTAQIDHECTHCDTPITAHSLYEREVFATAERLEPEKMHLRPPCADAYYVGK